MNIRNISGKESRKMNYIILDLEWNQSNEGKEGERKEIPFEIIEIGAVKLNESKEITGSYNELIRPEIYQEMHHITGQLIHLEMEELKKGRPFFEILKEFLEWCGPDVVFGTWGSLDLVELQRNMKYYGMEPLAKGPMPYLDIQKLFSIAFEDRKSRRTLEHAVTVLNMEKDIPFHRAFSDAYYAAKIFQQIRDRELEKYVSFDVSVLPVNRKNEIHAVFPDYAKYISRGFEKKEDALNDREVLSTRCYLCRRNAKRRIRWFTSNGKHYYSVSECSEHGLLKGKIRIRKSDAEQAYIIKTLKLITEDQAESIRRKKDNSKRRINRNNG